MTKTKEGQFEILDKGNERYPSTDILPPVTGPMEIMMEAVRNKSGKDTLETLKGMIEYQRKCDAEDEANAARRAYYAAMALFAADPPTILKDKEVGYDHKDGMGKTAYKHATLSNVAIAIQEKLSPHGLHASWKPEQGEKGRITVTCIITHELGHSESIQLSASPDDSGKKNNIQAIGSTISYLERYTILALTGLAAKDQDNDGVGSGDTVEYINTDQVTEINDLIKDTGVDTKTVLQFADNAESVETIPKSAYKKVRSRLLKNKAAMRQPGDE